MLASTTEKMAEWKHPYTSVPEGATDKRKSRSILMCVVVLTILAVAGVLVGVVLREQAMANEKVAPSPKGHQLATAANCDPNREKFLPSAGICVVCLNPMKQPSVTPEQCSAGWYYDEKDTCACAPCLQNRCCPGRGKMVACPIGSYQSRMIGGKSCVPAAVSGLTQGFNYDVKRPLFTEKQISHTLQTVTTTYKPCQSSSEMAVAITGFILPPSNELFSINVLGYGDLGQSARIIVTRRGGSQIAGFATSLVCVDNAASGVAVGTIYGMDLTEAPKQGMAASNHVNCKGSVPQVFAALSHIENSASAKRLAISLKANPVTDSNGYVTIKSELSSASNAMIVEASTVTFCASDEAGLAPGFIQTGLVDGGAIGPKQEVIKTVQLESAMKCSNPRIALGITELDVTGSMALNLEVLPSTGSTTSFRMKFVSMGQTSIESIQAAYLVTCPLSSPQLQAEIDKVCSPAV